MPKSLHEDAPFVDETVFAPVKDQLALLLRGSIFGFSTTE